MLSLLVHEKWKYCTMGRAARWAVAEGASDGVATALERWRSWQCGRMTRAPLCWRWAAASNALSILSFLKLIFIN
jgi:hypothetical protein